MRSSSTYRQFAFARRSIVRVRLSLTLLFQCSPDRGLPLLGTSSPVGPADDY